MKFNQQEDGSCDLIFSDEEIKVINKHKKLYFTPEFLRHFSNALMRMSVEFNERFDEKTKNLITQTDTILDLGKSKKDD